MIPANLALSNKQSHLVPVLLFLAPMILACGFVATLGFLSLLGA